jgi:hypothetical protein
MYSGDTIAQGNSAEVDAVLASVPKEQKEFKVFCEPVRYELVEGDTRSGSALLVRTWKLFVKEGYAVQVSDNSPRSPGKSTYQFASTDRFAELGLRKEGSCYFNMAFPASNVKVVSEEKHPQFKSVTEVGIIYDYVKRTEFTRLYQLANGMGESLSRKARYLVVKDAFQGKAFLKRMDFGDRDKPFSTTNVPDGIMQITFQGLDSLR